MDTSTTLRATIVTFFIATNLLVWIKTDTDLNPTSISPPSQNNFHTSSTIYIEPLPEIIFGRRISYILSPDVFLQSDPLAHLLSKVTREAYNGGIETLPYINTDFEKIRFEVDFFLRLRKFPPPYVLYAKFLSSLLSCLIRLHPVAASTSKIRLKYSNKSDYPPLSPSISMPELRALFSPDIFSDSDIPTVLLKKLLKIPDDIRADLKKELENFLYTHDYTKNPYFYYMKSLRLVFKNGDELFILRYEYAQIRERISNSSIKNVSNNVKIGKI